VTGIRAGQSGVRFPVTAEFFLCSQKYPAVSETDPAFYSFPGVKRLAREADRSPPSRAEERLSGAVPLLPLYASMDSKGMVLLLLLLWMLTLRLHRSAPELDSNIDTSLSEKGVPGICYSCAKAQDRQWTPGLT